MQVFRQRIVFAAALYSVIFISGCGQTQTQKQEPASTADTPSIEESETAADEADTTAASSESDTEVDFANLSIDELVAVAEKSLAANDVEPAKKAMTEARSRDIVYIGLKFDIARVLFGTGEMKAAVEVYDEILEERPDIKPQLWQRGLALYYAEEYKKGVDQFDTHQTYNSQDVENSVWQLLCQSRLTSVEDARKSMIQIERDSRIPMKQVFDMFAGSGSPEEVIAATGYVPEKVVRDSSIYHGWLYVGLFHEMMGKQEAANEAMQKALKCKPIIPSLMGYVAEGHLRTRKAFPTSESGSK